MGQQEILDYLRKNKGNWYTTKELSKAIGTGLTGTTYCAKKLRQAGFVTFKAFPFQYKHKNNGG